MLLHQGSQNFHPFAGRHLHSVDLNQEVQLRVCPLLVPLHSDLGYQDRFYRQQRRLVFTITGSVSSYQVVAEGTFRYSFRIALGLAIQCAGIFMRDSSSGGVQAKYGKAILDASGAI